MELVELLDDQIRDAELRKRHAESSRCAITRHFLALEAGEEIGFISVDAFPDAEHFVIYEIFVPSGLRGVGLGRGLLKAAEEMAHEHGYRSALLVPKTLDESFPQIALEAWYERLGYTPLDDSVNRAVVKALK